MDSKISHIINQINVEPLKLFRPVMSGLILNCFYSALILKKSSGIEITEEIETQVLREVFDLYGRIDEAMQELSHTAPEKMNDRQDRSR